ncbi:hypothetical protein BJY04DRAFT_17128 [Aspergillus karnatakaensis]|uniref:uncharacterized protein n=1 Tax=Aspergillus karnatakaensis TaxID=1810916 RepID=UPI003CCCBFF0
MSALEVRRVGSNSKQYLLQLLRRLFEGQVLRHLFRAAVSLALLPLDNSILLLAVALRYASLFFRPLRLLRRRQEILQDVRFHPKTILITGVDTPQGLHVARCFYTEGHRVVGADITNAKFASGGSMSRALAAYYRVSKPHYVPMLLDIVLREKVDVWIPCSQGTSVVEDAMAKQAIESRTSCKSITLDTDLTFHWSEPDTFIQRLSEKDLPVVESHYIQSRDSIHKILHRSPTKTFHIRKGSPADKNNIILPKRTVSLTYSEVSRMHVSKDSPWLMQQHARLGEFVAELLVIHGNVTAILVRPVSDTTEWGRSPLNEGLAAAIHKLMDRFASKCGARTTGHITVRLMVDEELALNSVRYEVRIAGCTQGTAATAHLLSASSSQTLVSGYLTILSHDAVPETSLDVIIRSTGPNASITLPQPQSVYKTIRKIDVPRVLPALSPVAQHIEWTLERAGKALLFWEHWRFSFMDPLPWWWHTHVSWPLRELDLMLQSEGD